jgi:hypothetical protein
LRQVAFLTAGCMLAGHPRRRPYFDTHEREVAVLTAGCAARGIELRTVVWDHPSLEADAADAFVIGTTWDYTERPREYLATLERLAARRPLFNPLPVVRWIVVKPLVGASCRRQVRLRRGEALPAVEALPPDRCLIQPFLPSIRTEGEVSFLYFGGVFSHAVRKLPAPGDYRVQSHFGGRDLPYTPSPGDLAAAGRVLAAVEDGLLYARVDLVRDLRGRLVVMELELIEPYLYPDQGPGTGEAFADALVRRLGA